MWIAFVIIPYTGAVHILRHRAATKLHEAGWSVKDIMESFGWTTVETAMKYTHVSRERLQSLIKKTSNL